MPRCKHVFFTLNYVNLHSFIHINIQVFLVLLKSYFEILGKEKVFKRSSTVIHIMHNTRTRRDDYFPCFPFSIIEFLTIVKNMRGFRFFYQWESEGYLSFPGVRGGSHIRQLFYVSLRNLNFPGG